jgi:NAD(P)H-dependent FMN reductase
MSQTARVLVFAGSSRKSSYNRRLAVLAAHLYRDAGGDATLLNLADYPLPLYDGDFEAAEGLPAQVLQLRELFSAHQGLLIASPEYNSSISPLLKNLIDWVSRAPEGEESLAPYQDKCAALLSASPGSLGGIRGLVTLRSVLGNIGVTVLPAQFALARAHQAFRGERELADAGQQDRLQKVVLDLHRMLQRLHG